MRQHRPHCCPCLQGPSLAYEGPGQAKAGLEYLVSGPAWQACRRAHVQVSLQQRCRPLQQQASGISPTVHSSRRRCSSCRCDFMRCDWLHKAST